MESTPKPIRGQCKNYGIFGSVGIIVRVMREIMPARDFSRLSMASDVQTRPSNIPSTKTGLAERLLEIEVKLGAALEPRM
eukprot:859311-Prorocentrum_lima.AAC.1